ncbi:MAG TPA: hypothetical protein VNQ90_03895 [Chthoniobacteraceae bacterium]|nr:hypothetical protein [Chthoniobacteraceae bacterium]
MKKTALNEARFLALLEKVLPQTVQDPTLISAIYEKVAHEVRLITSLEAFDKFCTKGSIPDTEPNTIAELTEQLQGNFGEENVEITPLEDGTAVAVEINLPDQSFQSHLKVQAPGTEDVATEAPFVPYPVALPEDPELVWLLSRRENLGPDEASRALANIAEEFWGSKKGQTLQRQGVTKTFAEFISAVPASALKESGLKRFHKDPEALKIIRLIPDSERADLAAGAATPTAAPDPSEAPF